MDSNCRGFPTVIVIGFIYFALRFLCIDINHIDGRSAPHIHDLIGIPVIQTRSCTAVLIVFVLIVPSPGNRTGTIISPFEEVAIRIDKRICGKAAVHLGNIWNFLKRQINPQLFIRIRRRHGFDPRGNHLSAAVHLIVFTIGQSTHTVGRGCTDTLNPFSVNTKHCSVSILQHVFFVINRRM